MESCVPCPSHKQRGPERAIQLQPHPGYAGRVLHSTLDFCREDASSDKAREGQKLLATLCGPQVDPIVLRRGWSRVRFQKMGLTVAVHIWDLPHLGSKYFGPHMLLATEPSLWPLICLFIHWVFSFIWFGLVF